MRRMVSVWFPYWRTERLERRRGPLEKPRPQAFGLTETGKGGRRLAAVNRAAGAAGLRPGMVLTDAYAILPALKTLAADPAQESKDLEKLAAWCRRYAPWTSADTPDGVALDVTGACHLFGGEQALLDDLIERLARLGFTARAALAGTLGAAWALSHHGSADRTVVPEGEEARFIGRLPVRGLRLGEAESLLLERLGLTETCQLFAIPRAALRARLGPSILSRLDRALGREAEPLAPLVPETVYAARLNFPEPITSLESIAHAAGLLAEQVTAQLKRDAKGTRHYALQVYDTQGGVFETAVTLARPSHEPTHVLRLFQEKFTSLEGRFDASLAFDAATLYATRAERLTAAQPDLDGGDACGLAQQERLAGLLDRLTARLGAGAVTRFDFRESHIPERASTGVSVLCKTRACPQLGRRRPLLLLPRAEPLLVLAEVPDYPPRRFTWRRLDYKVVKAEGPERISPEWWQAQNDAAESRDYYLAEDETGRRFWLYREGPYRAGSMPRWYLHGLFA